MKKLLIFSAVLVGLLLLVTLAGAGMKTQHVAKASRLYAAPPERVWTALLSIRQLPFDRSDLANMESPVEKNRVPVSLEVLGSPIRIEAPTQRPPVELVVKTVDPGLAYSGTWTIVLTPEDYETRVTIVEDATIRSRALRFFVRTVLGDDVLLEGIFRAVKRKLSEAPRTLGG
ncbi:MAG: SRPBCC family protein [Thermoanaerobaculia bacterium]